MRARLWILALLLSGACLIGLASDVVRASRSRGPAGTPDDARRAVRIRGPGEGARSPRGAAKPVAPAAVPKTTTLCDRLTAAFDLQADRPGKLVELLGHRWGVVRCVAARALDEAGMGRAALQRALADEEWRVRFAAAVALQRRGTPTRDLVPHLDRLLSARERVHAVAFLMADVPRFSLDEEERPAFAGVPLLLACPDAAESVLATLIAMAQRDSPARTCAEHLLVRFGPKARAAAPLFSDYRTLFAFGVQLDKSLPYVCEERLKEERCGVFNLFIVRPTTAMWVRAMPVLDRSLAAGVPVDRATAAFMAGHIGAPAAALVPKLVPLLRGSGEERVLAAHALGRLGPAARGAVGALLEEVRRGPLGGPSDHVETFPPRPDFRLAAVGKFSLKPIQFDFSFLDRRWDPPLPRRHFPEVAVESLALIAPRDPRVAGLVSELCADPAHEVRMLGALAAGAAEDRTAVLALLTRDPSASVRGFAAGAAAHMLARGSMAMADVAEVVRTADPLGRELAAVVLCNAHDGRAPLEEMLSAPDRETRRWAACALAHLAASRDAVVKRILTECLRDDDVPWRLRALSGLCRLPGGREVANRMLADRSAAVRALARAWADCLKDCPEVDVPATEAGEPEDPDEPVRKSLATILDGPWLPFEAAMDLAERTPRPTAVLDRYAKNEQAEEVSRWIAATWRR